MKAKSVEAARAARDARAANAWRTNGTGKPSRHDQIRHDAIEQAAAPQREAAHARRMGVGDPAKNARDIAAAEESIRESEWKRDNAWRATGGPYHNSNSTEVVYPPMPPRKGE